MATITSHSQYTGKARFQADVTVIAGKFYGSSKRPLGLVNRENEGDRPKKRRTQDLDLSAVTRTLLNSSTWSLVSRSQTLSSLVRGLGTRLDSVWWHSHIELVLIGPGISGGDN